MQVENRTIDSSKVTAPGANKRRALGDITNAVYVDDGNNKKATTTASVTTRSLKLDAVVNDLSSNTGLDDRQYMQRPADDIDSRDNGNPLLVSAYVNEMYDHFTEMEEKYAVQHSYMSSQPYVNDRMRCILVDWLVFAHCSDLIDLFILHN